MAPKYFHLSITLFAITMLFPTGEILAADINGLVARYSFNGNAMDDSGNGNHGVVYGAALVSDRFGNPESAYSFDGIDDYIDIGNPAILNFGSGDFTILLWFKADPKDDNVNRYMVAKYDTPNYPAVGVGTDQNRGTYAFLARTFAVEARGKIDVADGNWHHFAIVFDRDEILKIYLDGQIDETSTNLPLQQGSIDSVVNWFIGKGGDEQHFKGLLDDIDFYDRALDESEIELLARNNLLARFRFSGNADDETLNQINGVVYGATLANDRFGNPESAYSFDGIDDYIDIGNSDILNFGSGDLTISLWFKADPADDNLNRYMVAKYDTPNYPAVGVGTDQNRGTYAFLARTFAVEARGKIDVADGNWHHFAVVFDRDEILKIYLDGQIDETSTNLPLQQGSIDSAVDWLIGKGGDEQHFTGLLDDIDFFGRALDKCEIQYLLGSTSALNNRTAPAIFDDQFSGIDAINSCLWEISEPFNDSEMYEGDGSAVFKNRGRLLSKLDIPDNIVVAGRFEIAGNSYDQFAVYLFTDGDADNSPKSFHNGLITKFSYRGGDAGPVGQDNVHFEGQVGSFDFALNTFYDFRIVVKGDDSMLFLDDLTMPFLTSTGGTKAGRKVGFQNREGSGGGSSISAGSVINVDYVTAVSLSSFQFGQWQLSNFDSGDLSDELKEETIWGKRANPDGDRFPNLLEYFMGLDPLSVDDDGAMEISADGDTLCFTYRRGIDVDPAMGGPEFSTDLEIWWSSEAIIEEVVATTDDYVLIKATIPVELQGSSFFVRMRAIVRD